MSIERGRAALELWKAATDLERAINKQLMTAIECANWDEVDRLQVDAERAREHTNNALAEFHRTLQSQRNQSGVSGS